MFINKNYKKCANYHEGFYTSDTFQKYDACILKLERPDYGSCNKGLNCPLLNKEAK